MILSIVEILKFSKIKIWFQLNFWYHSKINTNKTYHEYLLFFYSELINDTYFVSFKDVSDDNNAIDLMLKIMLSSV
jgi:hypothetical protein